MLWDPEPVLYFSSQGSGPAPGSPSLRIWFAYLSYSASLGKHSIATLAAGPLAAASFACQAVLCPASCSSCVPNPAAPAPPKLLRLSPGRHLPDRCTRSRGGRDVWYTPHNSVIVGPTQEAVKTGVERAIDLLRSGAFERQRIRAEALQLARSFRATLNAEVQAICERHGVRLDAAAYFTGHFVHKLGLK